MSAIRLQVRTGRANVEDLVLLADDVVVDPTSISRVTLQVGPTLLDSALVPGLFEWPVVMASGVYQGALGLRLKLGGAGLATGTFLGQLTTYDPSNLEGLVWETSLAITVLG